MRREIHPVVGIVIVAVILAIAGGYYLYTGHTSSARFSQRALTVQSSKTQIPAQPFIPEARG